MGKSGSAKVYDYLYSLDYGLCLGPIDSINQVWVKDKPIFCGSARGRTNICVDQPEVFGGDTKEGGVRGVVEVYPGSWSQTASEQLAARAGRTPETFPGYRGQAHMFFRGNLGTGFMWGTNNPYLPPMKASITSIPRGLGSAHSVIWPKDQPIPDDAETGVMDVPAYVTEEAMAKTAATPPIRYNGPVQGPTLVEDYFVFPISQGSTGMCDASSVEKGWVEGIDSFFPSDGEGGYDAPDTDDRLPTTQEIDSGVVKYSWKLSGEWYYPPGSPSEGYEAIGAEAPYNKFYGALMDADGVPILDEFGMLQVGDEIAQAADAYDVVGAGFVRIFTLNPGVRFIGAYLNLRNFLGSQYAMGEHSAKLSWFKMEFGHCQIDGGLGALPDANPMHIIYDSMTNSDWGMGEAPELFDVDAFKAVAEALYNEGFGLSMLWNRQDRVRVFIQEVLDHIKCVLYQDPETGLWTPKLLRGDYDIGALPWLNPDNCVVKSPKRQAWGETINAITVQYTDPITEELKAVSAQNLAGIAIVGKPQPETRNYYAIRNGALAQEVANRDVIEAGTPLWSGTIEVDRTQWRIKPGDCRRLYWPDEDIEMMVVRVLKVDYGKRTDRKIKLSVVEDIFAVDSLAYSAPQPSLWEDDNYPPQPLDAVAVVGVPMPELLRRGATEAQIEQFPAEQVAVMGSHGSLRVLDIRVKAEIVSSFGVIGLDNVAVVPPTSSALLPDAWALEVETVVPRAIIDTIGKGFLLPGSVMMLGGDERDAELVMLREFDASTQSWLVDRAIYDTIPRAWPAGTRLWKFPDSAGYLDPTARPMGTNAKFWLMPRTRLGRLPYRQANTIEQEVSGRRYLPHRPANCQIDGNGFAILDYSGGPAPAAITATWVNRNRLLEDTVVPRWTDPNVTPEVGQTTTLRVRKAETDDIVHEYTGLSGTSFDLTTADFIVGKDVVVEFIAVRDELESLQFARRRVILTPPGWGAAWGNNWGQ